MKKVIIILGLFSILAFSSDKGIQIPNEDIQYRPPVPISTNSQIISGRDNAQKKTQTMFTYNRNNVYEVYAMPDFLTTFELSPDEEVTFLAGGDTENWQIEEAKGGEKQTTFIFVKPLEDNLNTNIIITTNRRLYNIKIKSTLNEYNSLVRWNYPETADMIRFSDSSVQTTTTSADKINMDYSISNNIYPFAPNKIFDDGNKTYFRMKKNMSEMPVIFMKGDDGKYSQIPFIIGDNGEITVNRTASKFKFVLGKKSVVVSNRNYLK